MTSAEFGDWNDFFRVFPVKVHGLQLEWKQPAKLQDVAGTLAAWAMQRGHVPRK